MRPALGAFSLAAILLRCGRREGGREGAWRRREWLPRRRRAAPLGTAPGAAMGSMLPQPQACSPGAAGARWWRSFVSRGRASASGSLPRGRAGRVAGAQRSPGGRRREAEYARARRDRARRRRAGAGPSRLHPAPSPTPVSPSLSSPHTCSRRCVREPAGRVCARQTQWGPGRREDEGVMGGGAARGAAARPQLGGRDLSRARDEEELGAGREPGPGQSPIPRARSRRVVSSSARPRESAARGGSQRGQAVKKTWPPTSRAAARHDALWRRAWRRRRRA